MLPLLDTDQLRTLVAIAETGNFTKAAEEVNKNSICRFHADETA